MKKHKKLWIVLLIAAVLLVAVVFTGTDDPEKPSETTEAAVTSTVAPTETEAQTTAPVVTEETETTQAELIDGMRPEFKNAMDSYEEFMNEYCEFMEEYDKNSSDLSVLAEYAELMIKYEKSVADFEKWEEDTLNDAESAYYLEVSTRVLQKLSAVAENAA